MKQLLLLLIIPVLSFGQSKKELLELNISQKNEIKNLKSKILDLEKNLNQRIKLSQDSLKILIKKTSELENELIVKEAYIKSMQEKIKWSEDSLKKYRKKSIKLENKLIAKKLKEIGGEDYIMSMQEENISLEVLSLEGANVTLEMSYKYHPKKNTIQTMHREIGPNYHEKLILPCILSITREVLGEYTTDEVNTNNISLIESEILKQSRNCNLIYDFINLDRLLIKNLVINNK